MAESAEEITYADVKLDFKAIIAKLADALRSDLRVQGRVKMERVNKTTRASAMLAGLGSYATRISHGFNNHRYNIVY